MPYLHTTTILEALKERLVSLCVQDTQQPLFERVGYFGANRLLEAMRTVFATERRVAFLVPGGDQHTGAPGSSLMVHSRRTTRIALLIADQAFDADRTDALVGGEHAVGILELKDQVIDDLVTNPFEVAGLAFVPAEGEPCVIGAEGQPAATKSNTLGRECWLQWLVAYAGEASVEVPAM